MKFRNSSFLLISTYLVSFTADTLAVGAPPPPPPPPMPELHKPTKDAGAASTSLASAIGGVKLKTHDGDVSGRYADGSGPVSLSDLQNVKLKKPSDSRNARVTLPGSLIDQIEAGHKLKKVEIDPSGKPKTGHDLSELRKVRGGLKKTGIDLTSDLSRPEEESTNIPESKEKKVKPEVKPKPKVKPRPALPAELFGSPIPEKMPPPLASSTPKSHDAIDYSSDDEWETGSDFGSDTSNAAGLSSGLDWSGAFKDAFSSPKTKTALSEPKIKLDVNSRVKAASGDTVLDQISSFRKRDNLAEIEAEERAARFKAEASAKKALKPKSHEQSSSTSASAALESPLKILDISAEINARRKGINGVAPKESKEFKRQVELKPRKKLAISPDVAKAIGNVNRSKLGEKPISALPTKPLADAKKIDSSRLESLNGKLSSRYSTSSSSKELPKVKVGKLSRGRIDGFGKVFEETVVSKSSSAATSPAKPTMTPYTASAASTVPAAPTPPKGDYAAITAPKSDSAEDPKASVKTVDTSAADDSAASTVPAAPTPPKGDYVAITAPKSDSAEDPKASVKTVDNNVSSHVAEKDASSTTTNKTHIVTQENTISSDNSNFYKTVTIDEINKARAKEANITLLDSDSNKAQIELNGISRVIEQSGSIITSMIDSRLYDNNAPLVGVAAGDYSITQRGIWTKYSLGSSKQGKIQNSASFKTYTNSHAVGFDLETENESVLGVAYVNIQNKLKTDSNIGRAKIDVFSVYGRYKWKPNFAIKSNISYGKSDINFTSSGNSMKGRGKSDIFGFSMSGIYTKRYSNNTILYPEVGIRYNSYRLGKFTGKLAKNSDLEVSETSRKLVSAFASAKLERQINYKNNIIMPYVNFGMEKILHSNSTGSRAYIRSADMNIMKSVPAIDTVNKTKVNYGTGIAFKHSNVDLELDYAISSQKKYKSRQGSIKLKLKF